MPKKYRLFKQKKETPCCQQLVRVKTVEPGMQMRKCELCKTVSWFALEEIAAFPGVLKLRWLTDPEAERMLEAQGDDLSGLAVDDL